MRSTMTASAAALITLFAGCSYTPPASTIAPGSEVGTTGNIRFNQSEIGNKTYRLVVAVSPGLLETEDSMAQRMFSFATEMAARTCPRFTFISDPEPSIRLSELTPRTKQYIYRCQ